MIVKHADIQCIIVIYFLIMICHSRSNVHSGFYILLHDFFFLQKCDLFDILFLLCFFLLHLWLMMKKQTKNVYLWPKETALCTQKYSVKIRKIKVENFEMANSAETSLMCPNNFLPINTVYWPLKILNIKNNLFCSCYCLAQQDKTSLWSKILQIFWMIE